MDNKEDNDDGVVMTKKQNQGLQILHEQKNRESLYFW